MKTYPKIKCASGSASDFSDRLAAVRDLVAGMIEQHGEDAELELTGDEDGNIDYYIRREMNDEEKAAKDKKDAEAAAVREQQNAERDRQEYERLKAKFETKETP